MANLSQFMQWLRNPPTDWRLHLFAAFATMLPITCEMFWRTGMAAAGLGTSHYMFWFATPIMMFMFLFWGQRVFWGVLVGGIAGALPWFSPFASFVDGLDGALQVSLGVWLLRRFWPSTLPLLPSVRFFAIMIGLGIMLPVSVISIPTVAVFHREMYFASDFWNSYVEWCSSEIASVLIILPALLMISSRAFRNAIDRPLEMVVYIPLGMFFLVANVIIGVEKMSDEIVSVEGWLLVATVGFIMIWRNGVGGVIIANLVMSFTAMSLQVYMADERFYWITHRMLIDFNLYSCHLTGLTLIVAAGFFDYRLMHKVSRGVTARMLNVQVSERRRLAADLHDSVSQEFAAALMHLKMGISQVPDASQNENLVLAKECLNKGLKDLRQTAVSLRPEFLEFGSFADMLEVYCETFETRHGVDVLLVNEQGADTPVLSLEKREHLFRILQEALNNALQHGGAKTVTVTLSTDGKHRFARIKIEDDGIGFDHMTGIDMTDRPHLGLRLMQERAWLMGGEFRISSQPGRGTTVEVAVPFGVVGPNETAPGSAGSGGQNK